MRLLIHIIAGTCTVCDGGGLSEELKDERMFNLHLSDSQRRTDKADVHSVSKQ